MGKFSQLQPLQTSASSVITPENDHRTLPATRILLALPQITTSSGYPYRSAVVPFTSGVVGSPWWGFCTTAEWSIAALSADTVRNGRQDFPSTVSAGSSISVMAHTRTHEDCLAYAGLVTRKMCFITKSVVHLLVANDGACREQERGPPCLHGPAPINSDPHDGLG